MSSIRERYAATPIKSLKKQREAEDVLIASGGGRSDTLKLKDGVNKVRIYPKHEGEESYLFMRNVAWVSVESSDTHELVRRTILNAKTHLGVSRDPIEEYIAFVHLRLGKSKDPDDVKKIAAFTARDGGLGYRAGWQAYAAIISGEKKEFGLLEIRKTVRDELLNLSIIDDEDEAMETDPFTDPNTGLPVLITYNSKAKKAADYYKTQLAKKESPLTDEELESFDKLTPLSQLFQNKYTLETFETALEGIRVFDEENSINLFEEEELQEVFNEIKEEVLEALGEGTSKAKPAAKSATKPAAKSAPTAKPAQKGKPKVEEEDEEEEEAEEDDDLPFVMDKFDKMDRKQLITYKSENGYDLKFLKSHTDGDLRDMLRNYENKSSGSEEEPEEDDMEDPAPSKGMSLADLKKSLAAKKK